MAYFKEGVGSCNLSSGVGFKYVKNDLPTPFLCDTEHTKLGHKLYYCAHLLLLKIICAEFDDIFPFQSLKGNTYVPTWFFENSWNHNV